MRWPLLLVLLPSVAAGSELDRAATALISELALPSIEGFNLSDGLAVSVDLPEETGRLLAGLLLSRLAALGGDTAFVVTPGGDADARARREGAEWLLEVRGRSEASKLSLFAELRQIDPGLWRRPPAEHAVPIVATAEHVTRIETTPVPRPPPPEPSTPSGPRLRGPALTIRSVSEPVLALAACPLTETGVDDLLVLTPASLTVYSFRGGGLRPIAQIDLARFPRHPAPVRDPVGAIACDGRLVAFGTSGIANGRVVRARKEGKRLDLKDVAELSGIPVASTDKRWIVALTDAGTNRLVIQNGEARSKPLLDARGHQGRLLGVTTDYRLVQMKPDLSVESVLGTSGAGISAFNAGGEAYVVTTGNRPAEQDRLTLVTAVDGRTKEVTPVGVEGRVYATAVGRFRGTVKRELIAAARTALEGASDLLLVELQEGPK